MKDSWWRFRLIKWLCATCIGGLLGMILVTWLRSSLKALLLIVLTCHRWCLVTGIGNHVMNSLVDALRSVPESCGGARTGSLRWNVIAALTGRLLRLRFVMPIIRSGSDCSKSVFAQIDFWSPIMDFLGARIGGPKFAIYADRIPFGMEKSNSDCSRCSVWSKRPKCQKNWFPMSIFAKVDLGKSILQPEQSEPPCLRAQKARAKAPKIQSWTAGGSDWSIRAIQDFQVEILNPEICKHWLRMSIFDFFGVRN